MVDLEKLKERYSCLLKPISPANPLPWLPMAMLYKIVDGVLPDASDYVNMWHGRGTTKIGNVAQEGLKTRKVHGINSHGGRQADVVYLANDPARASLYGDFLFKVRANKNKFRPDDDFMQRWATLQARTIIPDDKPYTTMLYRKSVLDDFYKNPDKYKYLNDDSLQIFNQVAHSGSIPAKNISSVRKAVGATLSPEQDKLLTRLQQIIQGNKPTIVRKLNGKKEKQAGA